MRAGFRYFTGPEARCPRTLFLKQSEKGLDHSEIHPYRHQSFHRSVPRSCANADRRIGSKCNLQARRGKRDGRRRGMGSPTSVTTENPEPQRQGGAGSRGTPTAVTDVVDAAYSDERPSRGPWLSEAPPTEGLTGVLGEM